MSSLSYSHGVGNSPLVGMCAGELLDRTAVLYPERPVLIVRHQNRRYRYREFLREVERAARGLLRWGVAKGNRVGLWATNCAEWVIIQFAVARLGALIVNLNPAYGKFEFEQALKQ
jgi:fatty-acyl-CoA synthase